MHKGEGGMHGGELCLLVMGYRSGVEVGAECLHGHDPLVGTVPQLKDIVLDSWEVHI